MSHIIWHKLLYDSHISGSKIVLSESEVSKGHSVNLNVTRMATGYMSGNKFILGEGEKFVLEHYTRATHNATKHQESPILYKIKHHTG